MLMLSNGEPMLNLWFGNFYRPAFDNMKYVDETMSLIKRLGFNCVELDSKAWEDFRERYNGGPASQYVASQEYMMESAKRNGLVHCFLALYLNGDNLYPNIRFSPPIYGESVINADGSDGKWYRYWSDKARGSMTAHVQGLLARYNDNLAQLQVNGELYTPICSMWDPIVAPSFDEEGRRRYLDWLKNNYGTINNLNRSYGTAFASFDELQKEDYWYDCKYTDNVVYSVEDRDGMTPAFLMWCDNMKWKRFELRDYFASMKQRFQAFSEKLYLSPDMAQWSYFLNVDGSKLSGVGLADLWDTAMRGIDIYELAPYVDNCHFLTVPITPAGDPDAYVVSCQHSMMRAMNHDRDFMGGIFWGRFLYNDIYQTLTPCEIIGSIVASGAKGIWAYGINGLDDGGMLDHMGSGFLDSLSVANDWAKMVIPLLKKGPRTDIAILFPSAMACFEPLVLPDSYEHRLDLLGWYKACCDLGYHPDVIDLRMIEEGALDRYKVLIIPANSCYKAERKRKAERLLADWTKRGGVMLHGPQDDLVELAYGIKGTPHEKDCSFYGEGVLLSGNEFATFIGEEVLARYQSDEAGCIVRSGTVYSFGFHYGYAYTAKNAPHVPIEQKNNELYPISLLKQNILSDILRRHEPTHGPIALKDLETAIFENGSIIVNHTPHPVSVADIEGGKIFQYPIDGQLLMPRSAVFVQNCKESYPTKV